MQIEHELVKPELLTSILKDRWGFVVNTVHTRVRDNTLLDFHIERAEDYLFERTYNSYAQRSDITEFA